MRENGVWALAHDGNPIFMAVDYGSGDYSAECDVEIQPDGTIVVLDIRTNCLPQPPHAGDTQ